MVPMVRSEATLVKKPSTKNIPAISSEAFPAITRSFPFELLNVSHSRYPLIFDSEKISQP